MNLLWFINIITQNFMNANSIEIDIYCYKYLININVLYWLCLYKIYALIHLRNSVQYLYIFRKFNLKYIVLNSTFLNLSIIYSYLNTLKSQIQLINWEWSLVIHYSNNLSILLYKISRIANYKKYTSNVNYKCSRNISICYWFYLYKMNALIYLKNNV